VKEEHQKMRTTVGSPSAPSYSQWDAGSFAFDDFRFMLGKTAIEELAWLTNECAIDGDWSVKKNSGASLFLNFVDKLRTQYVDQGPGYCVLSGFDGISQHLWLQAFRLLSMHLGDLCPQNSSGLEIKEVKDRGTAIGEGHSSRYSDSRYGGSLHTDGAPSPMPVPDYFGLFCVARAMRGGAFQMVRASTVYDRLIHSQPEAVSILEQPFHFDRRDNRGRHGEKTALKPVFFRENNEICITYLREYINAGHAYDGIPSLRSEQVRALDALDDVLSDSSLRVEGYLNPGEVVLVDNKGILHGRTTFEDDPESGQKRLLLRSWIRKRYA
jgi:alpha-ketoglutarate-dependent taurine dioxygenase